MCRRQIVEDAVNKDIEDDVCDKRYLDFLKTSLDKRLDAIEQKLEDLEQKDTTLLLMFMLNNI